ncbi:MAG: sulfotransferase domain-containing protein [Acidobacteriota bacterium]
MVQRARTIGDFERLLGSGISPESVGQGMAIALRPTDVVISPYGKCGTTWLQQMVHTLRTRGDMDFDDISRVVPWIETSTGLGLDLDAEQRADPRAFKSHLPWGPMPRGGRYLISVRQPTRALISLYRFMSGWFLEPEAVSLEEFSHWFLDRGEGQDYWTHFVSWWQRRDDDDVLVLAFELMKEHPERHVRRVSDFIGVEADDDLIALGVENSSLSFMLRHEDKFDDLLMRRMSEEVIGLPPGSESAKVKAQAPEGAFELSEAVLARLEETWAERVAPACGLASYDDAVEHLRAEV